MNTYGQRLADALKAANKSRKELAAALGISVQAVGDVIRGNTISFTAENNAKAALFLKVSPNKLAGIEKEPRILFDNAPYGATNPLNFQEPTISEALRKLGMVIADSDELTRAQIKPILDQLFRAPEQALELGRRLEATATFR